MSKFAYVTRGGLVLMGLMLSLHAQTASPSGGASPHRNLPGRAISFTSHSYNRNTDSGASLTGLTAELDNNGFLKNDTGKSGWVNMDTIGHYTDSSGKTHNLKLIDVSFWVNKGGKNWWDFEVGAVETEDGRPVPFEALVKKSGSNGRLVLLVEGQYTLVPVVRDLGHITFEMGNVGTGADSGLGMFIGVVIGFALLLGIGLVCYFVNWKKLFADFAVKQPRVRALQPQHRSAPQPPPIPMTNHNYMVSTENRPVAVVQVAAQPSTRVNEQPVIDVDIQSQDVIYDPSPAYASYETPAVQQAQGSAYKFCTQCGAKQLDVARFCTQCGSRWEVAAGSLGAPPPILFPAGRTKYRVHVVAGVDQGRCFEIGAQGCGVGRERDNDIVLGDTLLSRHHCWIDLKGNELWVRDLESANGTLVDGAEIKLAKVGPGSRITVGDTQLLVEMVGEAQSAAPYGVPPMANAASVVSTQGVIGARRQAWQFPFVAMTRTKEKISGSVVALNKTEAIRAIERMGYVPIKILEPQPIQTMDGSAQQGNHSQAQAIQGIVPNDYVSIVISRLALGLGIVGRTLFSFKGRITRLAFGISMIMTTVFGAVAAQLIALVVSNGHGSREQLMTTYYILVYTLVMPVICWVSISLQVKRWHDRGKPGRMVFVNFIPVVGIIWALIELGFLRGTEGANPYGPDPLRKNATPLKELMISFKGRITCQEYWEATAKQALLFVAAFFATSWISFFAIYNVILPLLVFGLVLVAWVWSSLAIQVKRLHDRGKSGWMSLVNLIPVIGGIWLFIELGVLKGVEGDTSYGADPCAQK